MMKQHKRVFLDFAYAAVILVTAFALNLALLQWFSIPSVTPMVFVLGVFLIAWRTQGYFWGIASSLVSVMAVNYAFTYPYWAFNLIRPECLASAVVMLMVSIMTSTMTTQIKRQEQMKAEAEKERMRGNLLRAVSHDLRTPLTAICGYLELLENQPLPPGLKYWASKSRNPNSLRLRLTYAGRRIELAGDCYGQVWEGEELAPCDILKVPHHGDRLSLTPLLVEKLRPAHAVISCGAEYIPRKDRPSRQAAELLEARGARVWMTDAFSAPWHPPGWQRAILFQIHEDGTIQVPDPPSGG